MRGVRCQDDTAAPAGARTSAPRVPSSNERPFLHRDGRAAQGWPWAIPSTVRFRLSINERDLLTDTVPRPVGELPPGVRVLSAEQLQRGADRAFTGSRGARVLPAGEAAGPGVRAPVGAVVTGHRGVMSHDPVEVEVTSVLPGGNPSRCAISGNRTHRRASAPLWAVLGAAFAAGVAWLVARRRRRARVAVPAPIEPPPLPAAATGSVRRRARPARGHRGGALAARGEVARHYEAVADVLRGYLETAERIPAPERTTTELLWSLPPRLAESGLRRRVQEILGAADLVKFARLASRRGGGRGLDPCRPRAARPLAPRPPRRRSWMRFADPWLLLLLVIPAALAIRLILRRREPPAGAAGISRARLPRGRAAPRRGPAGGGCPTGSGSSGWRF